MSCFGYFCYVFDNWCKCSQIEEKPSKFHNPSTERITSERHTFDSFGSSCSAFNFYAPSKPLSTRNKSVKFRPHLDVVPRAASESGGDWIMRYTMNETNFNPWNLGARFRHFELVPWRKQKSSIDLLNNLGWEPPPAPIPADGENSLEIYRKIGNRKKWRRFTRKRLRNERKVRRHIKIRLMFAVEFRHSRTQVIRSRIVSRNSNAIKSQCKSNEIFVCDEFAANSRDAINVNCENVGKQQQQEHWGYFSQRNKGIEEILIEGQKLAMNNENKFDYKQLIPLKSSQIYYRNNRRAINRKTLLCWRCRKRRYIFISICNICYIGLYEMEKIVCILIL